MNWGDREGEFTVSISTLVWEDNKISKPFLKRYPMDTKIGESMGLKEKYLESYYFKWREGAPLTASRARRGLSWSHPMICFSLTHTLSL